MQVISCNKKYVIFMRRWILFLLPISLLLSCSSYKEITYTNSSPRYQETYNYNYGYYSSSNYVYSSNDNVTHSDNVDSLNMEELNEALIETVDTVDVKKVESVFPVLNINKETVDEVDEIKTNDFIGKLNDSKEKESKTFHKNKKERNINIIKWSLVIANVLVFCISPFWGLITIPLTISLVGCILYPSWLKNGYLDNLYLKIAVFVACYGAFIANLLWIFL